jgi:hypothetical protein
VITLTLIERARRHTVSDLGEARYVARKGSWQVRRALAANPHTHPEMLAKLVHGLDAGGKIRAALLENPNTPKHTKARLILSILRDDGQRGTRR